MMLRLRIWLCLPLLAAFQQALSAAPGNILQQFHNPTPDFNDTFGNSTVLVGDMVVIGAVGDDAHGVSSGVAHVFAAESGGYLRSLHAPAPAASGQFGRSAARLGASVLIGAPQAQDRGAVFQFDPVTGVLLQTYESPSPHANDAFGQSVVAGGGRILIGADNAGVAAAGAGAAYLFDAATGELLHTLTAPSANLHDLFGYAVAVDENRAVVGAPHHDAAGFEAGAVFVYDCHTGNRLLTLTDPTPSAYHGFGNAVAILGDRILVGAPFKSDLDTAGSAYLFDGVTGELLRSFHSPIADVETQFGYAVGGFGDTVLIGAYNTRPGQLYAYNAVTGDLLHAYANPETPASDLLDNFGISFDTDGSRIVIGSSAANTAAQYAGAAYLFEAIPEPSSWCLAAVGAVHLWTRGFFSRVLGSSKRVK